MFIMQGMMGAHDVHLELVPMRAHRCPKPKKHVRGSCSACLSPAFKKRSGEKSSGFGYTLGSWSMCLGFVRLVELCSYKDQRLPYIWNNHRSFRNVISSEHFRLYSHMRNPCMEQMTVYIFSQLSHYDKPIGRTGLQR